MTSTLDISKFENKRILIVGDIILDEFIETHFVKKSPEYTNVPILKIADKKQYLGGAANVALNIKKLKAIPYLVGTVGDDESSKIIYELLHLHDISNEYVFTNHQQQTTTKSRIFNDGKPSFRIDEDVAPQSMTDVVYQFLLKNIYNAITNHKPHAIILQDYNKGVLNPFLIAEILAIAKQHKMIVCVDPKIENWDLYKDVDLFKPNLNELLVISKSSQNNSKTSDYSVLEKYAKSLHQKINFKNLLVTLGADGNFIFDGNKSKILNLKSHIQTPDVCGAGDSVISVATLALLAGFTLDEIANLSNKAGYLACLNKYIHAISYNELVEFSHNKDN